MKRQDEKVRRVVQVSMPGKHVVRLDKLAENEGTTRSEMVRILIARAWKEMADGSAGVG